MTMEAQDVVDVFTVLTGAGVSATLEGGWGVEALLGGQFRDHRDVDLVVDQTELPTAVHALARAGFEVIDHDDDTVRLGDDYDRVIDLRTVATDQAGNGWTPSRAQEPDAEPDFPAVSFTYGWVAGRQFPCISPGLQAERHRGYPLTDDAIADVHRLHERFFVPLPPELR